MKFSMKSFARHRTLKQFPQVICGLFRAHRNISVMKKELPLIPKPKGLPESKVKLEELLEVNHRKYDIQYMDFRANHIPHALCSLFALGATPAQIQNFNDYFVQRLEPLLPAKFTINKDNWESYITNKKAYREYLDFFDKELETQTILQVFKKYVPRLIPGLVGAALHPLIHLGYALEFDSKVALSEGLAYACITYNQLGDLIDTLDPSQVTPNQTASQLLKSIDELNPPDFLHEEGFGFSEQLAKAAKMFGPQIKQFCNQWDFDAQDSELVCKKTSDLTVASVHTFCGSYRGFSPDFFYCHGVTGNHAIRTILPYLEAKDQRRLLQVGFLAMVALYFTRGPVEFDQNFVYKTNANSPGPKVPTEDLDWSSLIELAKDSKDDHLIKAVRSLKIIQDTIKDEACSKFLPNLCLEGSRLVLGTIKMEDDWFIS